MENKVLTPARIDEKDITTDFVYNMFDGAGEFIERISKGKYHIVGYWHDRLIEVTWCKGSNRMCFAFVDLLENHHREEDEKKLIDFIKEVNTGDSSIFVEVWKSGKWIISDYYFKDEG